MELAWQSLPKPAGDGSGGSDTAVESRASPKISLSHHVQAVAWIPRIPSVDNRLIDHHIGHVAAAPPIVSPGSPSDITAAKVEVDPPRIPVVESPRHPGPVVIGFVVDPVPVVVGKPSPRFMAQPGPTHREIAPAPKAKWTPSHRDMRHPDPTVWMVMVPMAIPIQIIDSRIVAATYVAYRMGPNNLCVSAIAPQIEGIRIMVPSWLHPSSCIIDHELLTRFYSLSASLAFDLGPSLANQQPGGSVPVDLNPVKPTFLELDPGNRCPYRKAIRTSEPYDQVPLVNLEGGSAIR